MEKIKTDTEVSRPVHFRHYQESGRTIAVASPTRKEFVAAGNLLRKGKPAQITLYMGIARLHPKDQYCKKTGRETACSNITPYVATVEHVSYDANGTRYSIVVKSHSMEFYRRHGKLTATLHNVFETDAL